MQKICGYFFFKIVCFGCFSYSSVISKRKFLKFLHSIFSFVHHKITEGNLILDHDVSKLSTDSFLTFHKAHNKPVYLTNNDYKRADSTLYCSTMIIGNHFINTYLCRTDEPGSADERICK